MFMPPKRKVSSTAPHGLNFGSVALCTGGVRGGPGDRPMDDYLLHAFWHTRMPRTLLILNESVYGCLGPLLLRRGNQDLLCCQP